MVIETNDNPFRTEALLYQEDDGYVQCNTCMHRCKITENSWGFCKTKKNFGNLA